MPESLEVSAHSLKRDVERVREPELQGARARALTALNRIALDRDESAVPELVRATDEIDRFRLGRDTVGVETAVREARAALDNFQKARP